jgi:hypothetical protein
MERYWAGVLTNLGAPVTAENLAFLDSWAHNEGTAALNNPLATTLTSPGSYPLPGNSAGVQQYSTPGAGELATSTTLKGLSVYAPIVRGLRSGHPYQAQVADPTGFAHALQAWSGSGYTQVPSESGFTGTGQTGIGAFGGAIRTGETSTASAVKSGAQAIASAASFPERAFDFLTSWRFAEVVGGALLLLAGVLLLGRQFGLQPPLPPGLRSLAGPAPSSGGGSSTFQFDPGEMAAADRAPTSRQGTPRRTRRVALPSDRPARRPVRAGASSYNEEIPF